jgi:hypothetical protein
VLHEIVRASDAKPLSPTPLREQAADPAAQQVGRDRGTCAVAAASLALSHDVAAGAARNGTLAGTATTTAASTASAAPTVPTPTLLLLTSASCLVGVWSPGRRSSGPGGSGPVSATRVGAGPLVVRLVNSRG